MANVTEIKFTKMHGYGNDYIYINCMEREIASPEALSVYLSDRHFGVGGDGLILILPSESADARMRMFNADGSEGKMCGNAIRCVAKYLYDNGIVPKPRMRVETLSGIKEMFVEIQDSQVVSVKVDMDRPGLAPESIPVDLTGEIVVDRSVNIGGEEYRITCVSMGSAHVVTFCDDPDKTDLDRIGPLFERDALFPDRVNAEFVQVIDERTLKMRVWERGSGETMACGTGACASAVAAVLNGYCRKGEDIRVCMCGGELIINYTGDTVYMTGGCDTVFEGTAFIRDAALL